MKVKVKKIKFNDYVPRGVFEQIRWEKDIAMQQLEELAVPFGAKPELYAKPIVHAHWTTEFCCSVCGQEAPCLGRCVYELSNYCPNCGAYMVEEELK